MIRNWQVRNDISLTDCHYIQLSFTITANRHLTQRRNPKKTDCAKINNFLAIKCSFLGDQGPLAIEAQLGTLNFTLLECFEEASPITNSKRGKTQHPGKYVAFIIIIIFNDQTF